MTAMITPFREGRLDESRLREQIEFQIRNGIDALVPVGTTGESPTLDVKEHERVIELTVETARGRVPVIAGTGANATSEALELHTFAKSAGANACLSVNPYYNKPSQEGLYRHFMTLADRVELPIVLYNIPGGPASRCRRRRSRGCTSTRTSSRSRRRPARSTWPARSASCDDHDPQRRRFADAAADVDRRQGRDQRAVERDAEPGEADDQAGAGGEFCRGARDSPQGLSLDPLLFLDGNPAGSSTR
jgi:hypothetical protein